MIILFYSRYYGVPGGGLSNCYHYGGVQVFPFLIYPLSQPQETTKAYFPLLNMEKNRQTGGEGKDYQGTTIDPMDYLTFEKYSDVIFSWIWGRVDDQDSNCVRSQSGFILAVGGDTYNPDIKYSDRDGGLCNGG